MDLRDAVTLYVNFKDRQVGADPDLAFRTDPEELALFEGMRDQLRLLAVAEGKDPEPRQEVIFTTDFEQWWRYYPKFRRKAKKAARLKWSKLSDLDRQHAMMDVVGAQRATRDPEWAKDGGKYAPMPTTYLNQERWTDEWRVTQEPGPETMEQRAERMAKDSGMPYEQCLEYLRERQDDSERHDG